MKHPIGFFGGLALLILVLSPPVHAVSDELFSAHMVQHLVLVLVAAPFIAWGIDVKLPRILRRPAVIWGLHALALWAWHLPLLYDAAVANIPLHLLEHATFLGTGVLFWGAVLGRMGLDHLRRLGLTFATTLQSAALGAIIAFASTPLYASHLSTAPKQGLTPLEDQQLAGAIMWVPPGTIYLVVMLLLLWGAFRRYERVQQVEEPS